MLRRAGINGMENEFIVRVEMSIAHPRLEKLWRSQRKVQSVKLNNIYTSCLTFTSTPWIAIRFLVDCSLICVLPDHICFYVCTVMYLTPCNDVD